MRYFVVLFLCCCSLGLTAQQMSWKKHDKEGDKLFELAKYSEAAEHYQQAWEKKSSKKELIYKAAECFYLARAYRKAAEAYQPIKEDRKEFALAGLKYARCLKQDGQYEAAKAAFLQFFSRYQAADYPVVKKIVDDEVKGCELALQLAEQPEDDQWNIEALDEQINSSQSDFAPLPFSEDILYFSSTKDGKSKIYRTQRKSGQWSPAVIPNLPKMDGHICNGTFSPDHERFYYTICSDAQVWAGVQSKCDIYMTVRKANSWVPPVKLRDYVKMGGTTATQPFAVYQGKMEILYFSSNRPGGKGGMDIWYMTRPIDSGDIDFSLPRNAGKAVNTVGDEVTPFYHTQTNQLYFSSNGHAGIGGFDVFKTQGQKSKWSNIEHLGLPVNSSADDYYYQFFESPANAYVVSNRLLGLDKIDASNEDIFSIATPEQAILVKGKVFDQQNKAALTDIQVNLYEIKDDGQQRLLNSQRFAQADYAFELIPNRNLRITVEKEGYSRSSYDFNTHNYDLAKGYGQDLYLQTTSSVQNSKQPVFQDQAPSNNSSIASTEKRTGLSSSKSANENTNTRSNKRTAPPATPRVNTRPSTTTVSPPQNTATLRTPADTPTYEGTYFKVQLTVVIDFLPNDGSYRDVKQMGRLDTEYLPKKNWTRVLLADFFTLGDARNAMLKAHRMGFPEAFLVKYRNGKRVTP